MSAEASGWTWKHSPYRGGQRLCVALAIADVVNDVHDNEFWMSTAALAAKARVSRSTVTTALAEMVESGWLRMVESGQTARKPSRYQFMFASAPGALADPGSPEGPSAPAALDTRAPRASTSAPGAREPKENPKEPNAAGRPRNPLFDAVVEVCNYSPEMTRTSASMIGKAVRELKEVNATEDEIRRRAARYRARFRNADLTPTALLKHWPALGRVGAREEYEPDPSEAERDEEARQRWIDASGLHDE